MSMPMQRVVIPKGLVNPYSTTIVEIPPNLQHADTVIARPKITSPSAPIIGPHHHRMAERRSFSPCRAPQDWGYEGYNPYMPDHAGNVPFEEMTAYASRPRHRNHSPVRYQEQQIKNHFPVGAHEEYFEKKMPPAVSFSPSTKLEGDGSDYPCNDQFDNEERAPHPQATSRSRSNSPSRRRVKPTHETEKELLNSLGQLESSELQRLMEDLNNFQSARRKLVFDATSLPGPAEISQNILKPY